MRRDSVPDFVLGPLVEAITDPSAEDVPHSPLYQLLQLQGKTADELTQALTDYYRERYEENLQAGREAAMYRTVVRGRNGQLTGYAKRRGRLAALFGRSAE